MASLIDMAHSELRALIAKAARGAGLDWGLAEEAGWAAEWLARRALPAADWATVWLDAALAGRPDPVRVGVALADRLAVDKAPSGPVALAEDIPVPGYLLPFLHRIALRHGAVEVVSDHSCAALVAPDGSVHLGPAWGEQAEGWHVRSAASGAERQGLVMATRVLVSPSVVECLEGLSLRTTVPPSDASRRDAGAATSDND